MQQIVCMQQCFNLLGPSTAVINSLLWLVCRDAVYAEAALDPVLGELKDIINLNMHFIGTKQVRHPAARSRSCKLHPGFAHVQQPEQRSSTSRKWTAARGITSLSHNSRSSSSDM